jgi:AcrR family transcriptional regulator
MCNYFLKRKRMMQRRRGSELEHALLDAAYAELVDKGYAKFTMDAVATRAGTSTPVLYRRWSDKHELLRAAIGHAARRGDVHTPDTGSLRGDLLALMRQGNGTGVELVATISVHLGAYYLETGSSPADLIDVLLPELPAPAALDTIYRRASDRGEIDSQRLSSKIKNLPASLMRAELLMTLRPVPDADIEEMVDTIVLPLMRPDRSSGRR